MSMDTVKFQLGQIVYSVLDGDKRGMVTGITFRPGHVLYLVTWTEGEETPHFDIELSTEKEFIPPGGKEATL